MSCTRCRQPLEETSNRPPEPRRPPCHGDQGISQAQGDREEGAAQEVPGPASGENEVQSSADPCLPVLRNLRGLEFWDPDSAGTLEETVPW